MTAPPRERRSRPEENLETATRLAKANLSVTADDADFDYDRRVVHEVDESIWQALFAGQFRLAVPCKICGRFLVSAKSKRNGVGAHCAAKAGA